MQVILWMESILFSTWATNRCMASGNSRHCQPVRGPSLEK